MTPPDADLGLFEVVGDGRSAFHAKADVSRCVGCGREKRRSYLGRCGEWPGSLASPLRRVGARALLATNTRYLMPVLSSAEHQRQPKTAATVIVRVTA